MMIKSSVRRKYPVMFEQLPSSASLPLVAQGGYRNAALLEQQGLTSCGDPPSAWSRLQGYRDYRTKGAPARLPNDFPLPWKPYVTGPRQPVPLEPMGSSDWKLRPSLFFS